MKNNFVLDTSFLSSLINSEDENNENAVDIYGSFSSEDVLFIPATVKLELILIGLNFARFSEKDLDRFIEHIELSLVEINTEFLRKFQKFVFSTKLPLKPVDYSILFTAFETKSKLLTFDKKLEKYYKKLQTKISAPRV